MWFCIEAWPYISAGILCGECRDEGKGVSALLNNCVTCSNASGLLILALSQLYIDMIHEQSLQEMLNHRASQPDTQVNSNLI